MLRAASPRSLSQGGLGLSLLLDKETNALASQDWKLGMNKTIQAAPSIVPAEGTPVSTPGKEEPALPPSPYT